MHEPVRVANCFLAGAPKSGTTFIASVLSNHHQIFVPSSKEPAFFSEHPKHGNFRRGWRFYEKNFAEVADEIAVVDASTLYLYDKDAPGLIKNSVSDPKVVFILRNPVDRVYSNYWQYIKSGFRLDGFDTLLARQDELLRHMVEVSRYHVHLQRFLNCFDRTSMRVFTYDRTLASPQAVFNEIYQFLGVEQVSHSVEELTTLKNASGVPRSLILSRLLRQKKFIQTVKAMVPGKAIRPLRELLVSLRWANTSPRRYQPMPKEARAVLWSELGNVPEEVEALFPVNTSV